MGFLEGIVGASEEPHLHVHAAKANRTSEWLRKLSLLQFRRLTLLCAAKFFAAIHLC